MRVLWTEQAQQRLEQIEDYIAADNSIRAITFVNELIDAGNGLADFPDAGHPPHERPNGPYEQILHDNYRIIFRRAGDTVFILSVFHGARKLRPTDLGG